MSKTNDPKIDANKSTVPPIDWKDARAQPRVRPQWDPTELANKMLDELDRAGRLNPSKQ